MGKKIKPFQANGAAIISESHGIIARSGNYLFKMAFDGALEWSSFSTISIVNGPIETESGFIFEAHQGGSSLFFEINAEGQLLWQSDPCTTVEASGTMTQLIDGNILYTYNCPSGNDNKLCQIIFFPFGKFIEQRRLVSTQKLNTGVLTQTISDNNTLTIAANANAFVTESTEQQDFILQFSLNERTNECISWEPSSTITNSNNIDLQFTSADIKAEPFDLQMIETTEAIIDTFIFPLTELCEEAMETEFLQRDTLISCKESWIVSLPDNHFFWEDGSTDNPRQLEEPGSYKAKNEDCLNPIHMEYTL